jgi:histidine decarboxylase
MTQISVVGEARANVIPELIEALGSAGVNIETLDSQTIGPTVVAILTVDRYDDAVRTLAQAGFHAVTEDALLVRLEDKPGALAEVARRFHAASVPLHSVRIVRRGEGWGVVALGTPRTEEALALVGDALIS